MSTPQASTRTSRASSGGQDDSEVLVVDTAATSPDGVEAPVEDGQEKQEVKRVVAPGQETPKVSFLPPPLFPRDELVVQFIHRRLRFSATNTVLGSFSSRPTRADTNRSMIPSPPPSSSPPFSSLFSVKSLRLSLRRPPQAQSKPAGVLGAIKEMMRKTNVYVEQLEQTRRAALGITEEDEEDEEVDAQGSNGKRKASKRQTSKKKAKKEVLPPMDFPQDPLVSGGALKSYQLEGVSWLIQRYIFAMHGAIVSLATSLPPHPPF
jgi:hypothetical protein